MLTTHYMEEAERLCDRVAIVDHGRVIAQGSPRELIAGLGGEHVIEFALLDLALTEERAQQSASLWSELPSVTQSRIEDNRILLSVTEPHVVLPALLERIDEANHELASLSTRHASLEDVFVKIAGRRIEAADEEVT